jgi:hypothetical protein
MSTALDMNDSYDRNIVGRILGSCVCSVKVAPTSDGLTKFEFTADRENIAVITLYLMVL